MTRASKSRAKRRSVPAKVTAKPTPPVWREPYSPYHELPFVTQDETGRVTSWWSPPKIEDVGGSHSAYGAQWDVGAAYAANFIEVMKIAVGYTDLDILVDIVKEIMRRGQWTNIEKGFLKALGEYIATGSIVITCWMGAAFIGEPPRYRDDGDEA